MARRRAGLYELATGCRVPIALLLLLLAAAPAHAVPRGIPFAGGPFDSVLTATPAATQIPAAPLAGAGAAPATPSATPTPTSFVRTAVPSPPRTFPIRLPAVGWRTRAIGEPDASPRATVPALTRSGAAAGLPTPTGTPAAIAAGVVVPTKTCGPTLDAFNRGDGGLGATWTTVRAGFAIAASAIKVQPGLPAQESVARWNDDVFGPDQYAQLLITTMPSGDNHSWLGVGCRIAASGEATYYAYYLSGSSRLLTKFVNGTPTVLGLAVGNASYAGDTIRLTCVGSQITAYLNGAIDFQAYDNSIADGAVGLTGYRYSNSDDGVNRADNFEGGPYQIAFYNGFGPSTGQYQIGRADGCPVKNLWRKRPENPLLPKTASEHAFQPSCTKVDALTYCYYTGGTFQVHVAWSADDGLTFTKWTGNTSCTGAGLPFSCCTGAGTGTCAHGDPIVTGASWDDSAISFSLVHYDTEEQDTARRWKMWYSKNFVPGGIGYAFSANGVDWTQYAGNPILTAGPAGAWDDSYVGTSAWTVSGGTWYQWFIGCRPGGFCQTGLATAGAPEGPYTKSASNPIIKREPTHDLALSQPTNGTNVVHVASGGTVFRDGEPIVIYGGSQVAHFVSQVVSTTETTITLRDPVWTASTTCTGSGTPLTCCTGAGTGSCDHTTADRIRSWFFGSVNGTYLHYDGTQWVMYLTGFQPFGGTILLERAIGRATAASPDATSWTFRYDDVVPFLSQGWQKDWDFNSAENLQLLVFAGYTPTPAFSQSPTQTATPTPTATPIPGRAAAFVSQSVPTSMAAGQTYTVSVTMRNSGSTIWTAAAWYRLGSANPRDNVTWGTARVDLGAGESIAPGQLTTFTWSVRAPATPGTYNFQWRMLQEGVTWFGAPSTNVAVTVTTSSAPNGAFVMQNVPSTMTAGQTYGVSVTMQNTGGTVWTAAAGYRLGSNNPRDNPTWGMRRVFLDDGDSIAPGQEKTFVWTITAPTTPATYNFQWRMLQESVTWFGASSANVSVLVTPP